jgi:ketosteroid isomerase-like protein
VSPENAETVRRLLQSVNDGNLDAALRELHSDARLDWSGWEAPDSGVYGGHAGWLAWISGRREDLGYVRFEATDIVEQPPDTVVTEVTVQSRGRASGAETVSVGAAVWTVRDGKVATMTLYETREDALKAVGLEQ